MHPARGILLKLISVTLFAVMSGLVKSATANVPLGEAVFFRSLLALPVIVAWLSWQGELRVGLRTTNPLGHVWRGFVGTTAMGLVFAALRFLPLPEATAIGYAAPLMVVIFAGLFLGEKVGVFRISTVVLGMVGVLIVLSPRITAFGGAPDTSLTIGALAAVGGAFAAALAHIQVRRLVQTERASTIVFWFSVTSTTLSLLTIPFGWIIPAPRDLIFLALAGILGGTSQILMTSAYRYADASVVAPFEYTSMLLALIIGYFVFDEVPTTMMLFGAALVIIAGVLIIWRERQLGLERAKQRKVTGLGG